MNQDGYFLTTEEAARRLHLCRKTIRNYIRDKKIKKCVRLSGQWLIPKESFTEFIKNRTPEEFV